MTFNNKDIVLVPFPFNDTPGFKKKPAAIISKDEHGNQYGKYICVAITSQEKQGGKDRYEHKLRKTRSVGLLYDNQWVLPNKLFSIEDRIIIKKIGSMDSSDFETLELMFQDLF